MYPHVGVDASGLAPLRAPVRSTACAGFSRVPHPRVRRPRAHLRPGHRRPRRWPPALGNRRWSADPPRRHILAAAPPAHRGTRPAAAHRHAGAPAAGTAVRRRRTADSDSARMMDLVERAQAGEAEAFGRLYDHYSDTVYRYIYYRVGGKATAEDLTSETFLRALRRIGTFTWQGRDFGAWLVTIARNLVADHFKSSRFRLEVTTGEMLDANEVERSPEDSVLESLSNAALLRRRHASSTRSSRSASRCASSRASRSPRPPGSWARTRARSRPSSTGPCAPSPGCCRTTPAERRPVPRRATDPAIRRARHDPGRCRGHIIPRRVTRVPRPLVAWSADPPGLAVRSRRSAAHVHSIEWTRLKVCTAPADPGESTVMTRGGAARDRTRNGAPAGERLRPGPGVAGTGGTAGRAARQGPGGRCRRPARRPPAGPTAVDGGRARRAYRSRSWTPR